MTATSSAFSIRASFAVNMGLIKSRLMGVHMSQGPRSAAFGDFADDDASSDDREIGGERTLTAKVPQDGKIVRQQRHEDFGAQIVRIVTRQRSRPGMSRVLDDMDEQSDESVDKVLPGPRLLVQALFEQIAVEVGESHGRPTPISEVRPNRLTGPEGSWAARCRSRGEVGGRIWPARGRFRISNGTMCFKRASQSRVYPVAMACGQDGIGVCRR